MELKINYNELKDVENFLFLFKYPRPFDLHISFYDNDEVYDYRTVPYDDFLVLVTC